MNLTYHPKKKFCSRGHEIAVVGRTKYGQCIECKKINDAKANANNKDKKIQWAEEHPGYSARYYEEHKEDLLARGQKYYEAHREKMLASTKMWRQTHPEIVNALQIKYQTNRGLRVVAWTDWENIIEFERNKPKGMTTDHYIPLQGTKISGLHVSWNLQYLTLHDNDVKGKKVDLLEVSDWYGKILEEVGLK